MVSRIAVLIASDLPMVSDNIAQSLESNREIRVVGIVNHEAEVLPLVKVHRPRVVLLDLNLDWPALCDLIAGLRERFVLPLLVSDTFDELQTIELLHCGASGTIPRGTTPEMLHKCIRSIAAGEIWISRQTFAELMEQIRTPSTQPSKSLNGAYAERTFVVWSKVRITHSRTAQNQFNLTRRELQMVQAIAEGMTNKEIAASFGISEFTVKHHLAKVFDKVGVFNRLELATFARNHGILGLPNPAAV